jgi:ribosomal protein L7Ae-like RNA K-turn-binding protein
MPISFADALKKAAKPPPVAVAVPPVVQPKKEPPVARNQTTDKLGRQQQGGTQTTKQQNQNKKHDNKRPPSQPQNGSSKTKKSKKPKSSGGVQLSDVMKLPQSKRQPQAPTLLVKPQVAVNLAQDFPSLGASSGIPAASTWGKAAVKPKAPLFVKPVVKKEQRKASSKAHKSEAAQKGAPEPASALLATFGAKQRSVEETNLMGTFLKDPSTIKKGRQRLGPRKKKFSTLKKKVLQERLEQWKTKNPDGRSGGDGASSACTVALWNYCAPEETEDEDELEEIVANLRDMGSKVGDLRDLHIDKKDGHAFCLFATVGLANAAQACWNGLVVGGDRLEAELVPSLPTDETWKTSVGGYRKEQDQETPDTISVVILENILTEDDLDDEDCLQESLQDIQAIASDLGNVTGVQAVNQNDVELTYQGAQKAVLYFDGRVIGGQVVSARLKNDSVSSVLLVDVLTEDDLEDADCLQETLADLEQLASQYGGVKGIEVKSNSVIVTYEGTVAQAAAASLNGRVICGQAIDAKLLQPESGQTYTVVLQNLLSEDDLEDEECLEETKSDVAELAKRFGPVTRVEVDIETKVVKLEYKAELGLVEAAVRQLDGMVIGGQRVSASLVRDDGEEQATIMEGLQVVEPTADEKEESLISPMFSGDKLIPERFADCKRAPKIPNAGTPRKYASLVNDEETKPLLVEMLSELMRLQKRAVEEKNTKAKRRLVMGLREVARGIRAHKTKIVVMANNLDQYGAIDEKLQEIIDLAREESVPIFYEFNKRGLGKAIGKNIKIGVIGVQNAEGAHQQFKKLISIANSHNLY